MNIKLLTAMGLVNHKRRKTVITYPDIDRWCNKLMRYLKISRKKSEKIACSKLVYYATNYRNLIKHDAACVNEPLENIRSNEHAMNIYRAYIRHTETDYDRNLHDLRNLENIGVLKENTHKNMARKGVTKNDVLKVLDNDVDNLDDSRVTYIKNRLN